MTDYPQLDARAAAVLADAVKKTSIAEVARRLGYSRPAISMALRGCYVGDTRHIRQSLIATLADRIACPFLDRAITPAECTDHRMAPLPSGPRSAVAHWQACRHCVFNPANYSKPNKETGHDDGR